MKLKWIVIPVLILAAALYVFYSKKNMDIPVSLIGKWTTSAPGYQDRFVEITKETLTYGLGGDKEDVYVISRLEENPEGKNIIYTINYKNEDVKYTRSFYYHPENGGTIQFKHQEHIKWLKEANAAKQ
jgi:hypothetical protein